MLGSVTKTASHLKHLGKKLAGLQHKLARHRRQMKFPKILKVEYDQLCEETKRMGEEIEILQEGILEWRKHYLGLVLLKKGRGWCTKCQKLVTSPDFTWLERYSVGWSSHHEGGSSSHYELHHLCHDCRIKAEVLSERLDEYGHGSTYYPCELVVIPKGTKCDKSGPYGQPAIVDGLLGYQCSGTGWLVTSCWALYRDRGWSDIFEKLWGKYYPSQEPIPLTPDEKTSV